MTFAEQLQKALQLATTYHEGQVDKRGEPFILHVLRVGMAGQTHDEIIVGLLHDIVEDTVVTVQTLWDYGFPVEVVNAVSALTRVEDETYAQYIDQLIQTPLAAQVKYYDLLDNLSPYRQDFEGSESLHDRHVHALVKVAKALGIINSTYGS